MEVLTMKELLETGVHFGHRTRKWNPKMARYIFTERKGIHIIDLEQTVEMFKRAYFFVRDRVAQGAEVMFVGTKKQVQTTIAEEARRCGAHYVNRRWLGGTLTNFATIKKSIERMKELERMIEDGTIDHFPNKEANRLRRELAKLVRNLDGLRHLERVPDIIYVIDPDLEANAVHEANIMKIPVIAIVDTNCDPDPIDFPIPGNDDAIKATRLISSRIADAVLEGREGRQEMEEAAAPAAPEVETTAEAAPEAASAEEVATPTPEETAIPVEEPSTTEAAVDDDTSVTAATELEPEAPAVEEPTATEAVEEPAAAEAEEVEKAPQPVKEGTEDDRDNE